LLSGLLNKIIHILCIVGIYCAKYYGQGGREMVPGKKMKNEAVRNKMKKKEKGERKKKKRKRGRVIFLLIHGTLLFIIVY